MFVLFSVTEVEGRGGRGGGGRGGNVDCFCFFNQSKSSPVHNTTHVHLLYPYKPSPIHTINSLHICYPV